jgi:cytochrome c oxidase assembly factor 5
MVDMRKRFRGNQPIAVSRELEGGKTHAKVSGGGQLYAGGSAFGTGVKETDGREPEVRDWREVENEKYRKEG